MKKWNILNVNWLAGFLNHQQYGIISTGGMYKKNNFCTSRGQNPVEKNGSSSGSNGSFSLDLFFRFRPDARQLNDEKNFSKTWMSVFCGDFLRM